MTKKRGTGAKTLAALMSCNGTELHGVGMLSTCKYLKVPCRVQGVGSVLSFSAQPDSNHGDILVHTFDSAVAFTAPMSYVLNHCGHVRR